MSSQESALRVTFASSCFMRSVTKFTDSNESNVSGVDKSIAVPYCTNTSLRNFPLREKVSPTGITTGALLLFSFAPSAIRAAPVFSLLIFGSE